MNRKIFGWLAAAVLAGPMTANALSVTISGQGGADGTWDVTTNFGSANGLANVLDDQVWWANGPLAQAFATAVGSGLGTPNGGWGPYFAHTLGNAYIWVGQTSQVGPAVIAQPDVNNYFAIARRVSSVPEPGSLALLGLGLVGLGFGRRRVMG